MIRQCADKHPQKSTTVRMNTIIKNCHIIMSAEHKRWLCAKELLVSQAIPAYGFLAAASCGTVRNWCSFNVDRKRSRTAMAGQAGNTMNVNMIGAGLLYILGFAIRVDSLFW